jgi:hypothetical protein
MSPCWFRRALWATAAVAGLALAPGANASARCAKRSSDPLAPVLIKPCAGARIRAGHNLTFQVRVSDPYAAQPAYYPYLNLTREPPRHGILPSDNGYGICAQMSPVRNRPGRFSYRAPRYHAPGYWLFRRGVWHVQALQVDGTGTGAIHYGPVERIVIH